MSNQDPLQVESLVPRRIDEPRLLVIFGGAGDLAQKKLLPALYNLAQDGLLPKKFAVLGTGRTHRADDDYRSLVRDSVQKHSRRKPQANVLNQFEQCCFYQGADVADAASMAGFAQRIAKIESQCGTGGARLFYVSTPPEAYAEIITAVGDSGLSGGKDSPTGIIIEKPFGSDLNTSTALNELLNRYFTEPRIYRIDHYLGKETVQNLLVFRFINAIFEPLLNRHYVHDVQITVAETEGIAGRGAYYDQAGALRDMVQNHLFQLLCLIAMDAPVRFDADDIRDEKLAVLKTVGTLTPEQVQVQSVRGQYAAAGDMAGYRQEKAVKADSQTESYVALRLDVANQRWAGVPFYLRTGKRLARKVSEIVVTFRREPVPLLGGLDCNWRDPNKLIFRIQPSEGISIAFDAKLPGQRMLIRPVQMDMDYNRAFDTQSPEAYEMLIFNALAGENSHFPRADAVEQSWKIIDSIRQTWDHQSKLSPLLTYPAGSWGPDAARNLFTDPETRWQTS